MAVDPGVVGVDVPLFPVRLRIGSDLVVRRMEETVLFREKEFSSRSRSAEIPLRAGRMEEGLGKEERFSGLLVIPSESFSFACLNTPGNWFISPPAAVCFRLTQE